MDSVNRRRLWGYPLAAVTAGALIYGGFVREVDPEAGVLLSSADIQLRLASGMPKLDKNGQPVAARTELLGKVRDLLTKYDRSGEVLPVGHEYWAFLLRLEGDYDGAIARYREGRAAAGCPADLRDSMLFNEVRTLHEAGRSDAAIQVLIAERDTLQGKYLVEADLLVASIHRSCGRTLEAAEAASAVAQRDGVEPAARVRSGRLLEELGSTELAEAAYTRAGEDSGLALYCRARLKVTQGAADIALDLLERAARAEPGQVERLLEEDRETWAVVQSTSRFQEIGKGTVAEPAQPGR